MDWNWFFSAVAQSTAAIVGIFAAFIITKIVNNQTEFKRKYQQIQEFSAKSLRLIDDINSRYFSWYNECELEKAIDKLDEYLNNSTEFPSPEFFYEKVQFPVFIEKEEIIKTIDSKVRKHKQKEAEKLLNLKPGAISIPTVSPISFNPNTISPEKLTEERELINSVIVDIKHNIRLIKSLLEDISTSQESSPLVNFSIISIILLFYVGVIYPLSFMPLETGANFNLSLLVFWDILFSLKGFLLFSVSLIFNIILIVFLIVNLKMKYSKEEISNLERFMVFANYSKYLKAMESNIGTQIK